MGKIKENLKNNKQTWVLIGALIVLTVLIFGIPQLLPDPDPCPPGTLYNLDTGKICPEAPAPYVDPATIIPGKG